MKKRKTEKLLTRDLKINLLQEQKVLNGTVFEPMANNSPGMRELVGAVDIQGWGHLFK